MSSSELMIAAFSMFTAFGAVLSGAVAKLWAWVAKRIEDCEADRIVLHARIENLNDEMVTISKTVGRMEGHLESIDRRRSKDHENDK